MPSKQTASLIWGGCAPASRHRDGVWRSADEVPQGPGGRPLAFIAVNGHGAYPVAGTIPRIFYAVWPCSRCAPICQACRGQSICQACLGLCSGCKPICELAGHEMRGLRTGLVSYQHLENSVVCQLVLGFAAQFSAVVLEHTHLCSAANMQTNDKRTLGAQPLRWTHHMQST